MASNLEHRVYLLEEMVQRLGRQASVQDNQLQNVAISNASSPGPSGIIGDLVIGLKSILRNGFAWFGYSVDVDHGGANGLGDDDHIIYDLLGGRAGGQTSYGGTAAGEDRKIISTAHATKGSVYIGGNGTSTVVEVDASANLIAAGKLRQGSIWHAYGGFQAASETIAIANVDDWYHITNATNDLWTGIESDGMTLSGDIITITNAGDYVGSLSVSMTGSTGKAFQIRCYNLTQAAQMGYVIGASTDGAGNFANVTLPLYLECNAGDTLRMEVRCITDASDPTFKNAVFYLAYLHD